jgi:hypothetical protein
VNAKFRELRESGSRRFTVRREPLLQLS